VSLVRSYVRGEFVGGVEGSWSGLGKEWSGGEWSRSVGEWSWSGVWSYVGEGL
jgi:hypothetical protein